MELSRAALFCDFDFRSSLLKKSQFDRNNFFLLRELPFTARDISTHAPVGELYLMTRTIFAAALALAAFGFAPTFTSTASAYDAATAAKPRIDISRIKSVLRLTPEQQAYWPPVEAALRMLARRPVTEQPAQAEGLFQRVSNRVYAYALDAATLARVGAAVRPLVKVLDDRQKNDAVALCHEMGLGQVLAALI